MRFRLSDILCATAFAGGHCALLRQTLSQYDGVFGLLLAAFLSAIVGGGVLFYGAGRAGSPLLVLRSTRVDWTGPLQILAFGLAFPSVLGWLNDDGGWQHAVVGQATGFVSLLLIMLSGTVAIYEWGVFASQNAFRWDQISVELLRTDGRQSVLIQVKDQPGTCFRALVPEGETPRFTEILERFQPRRLSSEQGEPDTSDGEHGSKAAGERAPACGAQPDPRSASQPKFTIRDLLLLTAIVAAYSAAFASLLRLEIPWRPSYLLVYATAAACIGPAATAIVRAFRTARHSGETVVSWQVTTPWSVHALYFGMLAAFVAYCNWQGEWEILFFPALWLPDHVTALLNSSVRISRSGIVVDSRFARWDQCGLQLKDGGAQLRFRRSGRFWPPRQAADVRIKVPEDKRAAVRAILAEHGVDVGTAPQMHAD